MVKNRILELIKKREKYYADTTEEAIKLFIHPLKDALEQALYIGHDIELHVLDISIVPQNFTFLRIEGKVLTVSVGDTVTVEDDTVTVDIENLWDFANPFVLIIPASFLDEAESSQIVGYLNKVKENAGKVPMEYLNNTQHSQTESRVLKEFITLDKKLDEVQLMALKLLKTNSIH